MANDHWTGTFAGARDEAELRRVLAGKAVRIRASFPTFDYDGRAVVETVHPKRYPDSPLIAVRIEHPKGRKRRVYIAPSEIVGPWEEQP